MRAAVIQQHGTLPVFGDFPEPPHTMPGHIGLQIDTAGLGSWDVMGQYRLGVEYPCVVRGEGVGRADNGDRYYFGERSLIPFGAFAERTLVPVDEAWKVPDDVDDVMAINMAIAATGAWVPLEKARIAPGESVLILGATGVLGRLALQFARIMGADRVVGAARNAEVLADIKSRGLADEVVVLGGGDDTAALKEAAGEGYDVVLDLVFGEPMVAALRATRWGARVNTVGVGAGTSIALDAADLLFRHITVVGTGQAAPADRQALWRKLLKIGKDHAITLPQIDFPLEDIATAWTLQCNSSYGRIMTKIR